MNVARISGYLAFRTVIAAALGLLIASQLAGCSRGIGTAPDSDSLYALGEAERNEISPELAPIFNREGLLRSSNIITVYYSDGYEHRIAEVRELVVEGMDFYNSKLGIDKVVNVAILDRGDWQVVSGDLPYGLPFVSGFDDPIVVLPATDDGVLGIGANAMKQYASTETMAKLSDVGMDFEKGARLFVNAIALHELGHVYGDLYRIQPRTNWFAEFLATYIGYVFLRDRRPELATVFEVYAFHLNNDAPGPQDRSLTRFEREYGGVGPDDYAWYQGMFLDLAIRLYDDHGVGLLDEFGQHFPPEDGGITFDLPDDRDRDYLERELDVLDKISPKIRDWAERLQAAALAQTVGTSESR